MASTFVLPEYWGFRVHWTSHNNLLSVKFLHLRYNPLLLLWEFHCAWNIQFGIVQEVFQHQHSFAENTVYRALEHNVALKKQYNLRLHYQLLQQVVFLFFCGVINTWVSSVVSLTRDEKWINMVVTSFA